MLRLTDFNVYISSKYGNNKAEDQRPWKFTDCNKTNSTLSLYLDTTYSKCML